MRRKNVIWGIVLICLAALLLIDGLGIGIGFYDIPVFKIAVGILIVAWAWHDLYRRRFSCLFFPAAFLFLLFEKEIAHLAGAAGENLINNWLVLFAALLLTIGTSILSSRKPYRNHVHIHNPSPGGSVRRCAGEETIDNALGSFTCYIDAAELGTKRIENSLGRTDIFFENTDAYTGDGTLQIENSLGAIFIHIPSGWRAIENCECSLGSVKSQACPSENGKIIHICGENSLGAIEIDYL